MCGILGAFIADGGPSLDRKRFTAALRTLASRGPDDEGIERLPVVATADTPGGTLWLGHRRLSILDLSARGHQPMAGPDGTVIVHNGEIYNFRELRRELERDHGAHFTTETDTEVVLAAYAAWVDACVERFEGMFAFALWDGTRRRLLLARDRLGIKPLYTATLDGGGFAFASEAKAVWQLPGLSRALDPVALAETLVLEYAPAPATLLSAVRKLPPAHTQVIVPGRPPCAPERYWAYEPARRAEPIELPDAAQSVRALLRDAVQQRLLADVPVGVWLSGGIDSSALAVCLRDLDRARAAFSIGFEEASFDESEHARAVAKACSLPLHHETLSSARVQATLDSVLARLDDPFADASILPTTLLAEFTRGTVTVALSGDGGDELFAGYPTYGAQPVPAP